MTPALTDALGVGDDLAVDFSVFIEDPSSLLPRSRNLTLNLGETRIFAAKMLSGAEIEAAATLTHPGRLTRVHKIYREPKGKDPYWMASYVVTGAEVQIEVTDPSDGVRISLTEFLRRIFNKHLVGVPDFDSDRFEQWLASKTGMRPSGRQNWFGMQMGALESSIDTTLELLSSTGGIDARDPNTNWGGIQQVIAVPRDKVAKGEGGVTVTSFEVGAMDRTKTQSGTGFQDLVHAALENFSSVLDVISQVVIGQKALQLRIDQNDQSLTEDMIRTIQAELTQQETDGRGYRATFGGATPHYKWDGPNKTRLILTPQFDPVSIPGGRMNYHYDDGREGVIDLWKPRKTSTTTEDGPSGSTAAASNLDIGDLSAALGQARPPEVIVVNTEPEADPVQTLSDYLDSLEDEDREEFLALSTEEQVEYLTPSTDGDQDPDGEPF